MCYLNYSKAYYTSIHQGGPTNLSNSRGALLEDTFTIVPYLLACFVSIPESQNSRAAPGSHQFPAGNISLTLPEQGMRLKAWVAAKRMWIGLLFREAHKLRAGASEAAARPAFPMAFNTSCICKYKASWNKKFFKCCRLYVRFYCINIFCANSV